ncbi:MAG: TonB-dependent receptor [Burkholderiaceae bacterium]|jgi:iron complex outermembrane receptor protein|nr:TonB-dependent receptor [Burkholderiaceae bacterium]
MLKRTRMNAAIWAAFGATLITVPAVQAQQQGSQQLERVEVTGSSIKRIEGETAAPVQVITRRDIERTGAVTVEELLRTVTATSSSNSTVAASASGATTGGISTISLRGLSSNRTLVLVNGRRVSAYGAPNDSSSVDVDSIPVAAIERIEVLKDGASAVYGSDAIAGVVNFILRRNFQGAEVAAGYGAGRQDSASVAKASAIVGFGDPGRDRFNVMAMVNWQKDEALVGAEREFARTSIRLDKDSFGGSSRSDPGNIAIPGVGVVNPRAPNCAPNGSFSADVNPNICLFDTGPFVTLLPATERVGVMTSGRFVFSPAAELYAELSYTKKEAQTVIQPSPIDAAFGIPFPLTTANPFYPTAFVQGLTGGATPTLGVRYRPFIIGNRDITNTGENTRASIGLQGTAAGWDYDTNLLYSKSQVEEALNGGYFRINGGAASGGPGIVPLLAGQVLGSNGQPLWVNPFGANSPEVVAAARATNFIGNAYDTETSLTGVQAKASRELFQLAGGGAAVAFGAELREDAYKLNSNAALGSGDISGYGGNFVSIDTDRKVYAAFAELSAPVTKAITVDGAVRFDNYGGTNNPVPPTVARQSLGGLASVNGDTLPTPVIDRVANEATGSASSFSKFTGKLGARWTITQAMLLRGTFSTGYRAPSLLELYGPLQSGVSAVINDPSRCVGANANNPDDCATQFNIFAGGNSQLKPESSRSFTLGLVLEPVRNVSMAFDYYQTEVKNLIAIRSASSMLEREASFGGKIFRGAADGLGLQGRGPIIAIDQRSENLGKTDIEGIDVDLRWQGGATPYGRFGIGLSSSFVTKWETTNPDGTVDNSLGNTSSTVVGVIPRLRNVTTLGWQAGKFMTSLTHNWQSGVQDICGNLLQDAFGNCPAGSSPKTKPYQTIDLQVRYEAIRNMGITVGIKNLLDEAPPFVNGAGGAFQSGYDPSWGDPRLRWAYVNLSYKFF